MAIFISTFVNSLDDKNRVVVPKDFRSSLLDHGAFVAFRSHKLNAIDCFTVKKMEELSEKIDREYDGFSLDRESLEAAIFADAVMVKFDKDGRIVLPDLLLQHANITKLVAFVGKGSTFQIWEPDAFKTHQDCVRAQLLEKK